MLWFQWTVSSVVLSSRPPLRSAWLGIRMDPLNDRHVLRDRITGIDKGAVVATIEAESPAYKSDLRAADVVTEVDGVKVTAPLEVLREILRKKIGATVRLTVWRAGATVRIPIAMQEMPDDITPVANPHPGKLGVSPKAETLGLKLRDARPAGALVIGVVADSPAGRAQMQSEDVITEVEGRTVRDATTAAAAIGDRVRDGRGKTVLVNIERKGRRTYVILTPE